MRGQQICILSLDFLTYMPMYPNSSPFSSNSSRIASALTDAKSPLDCLWLFFLAAPLHLMHCKASTRAGRMAAVCVRFGCQISRQTNKQTLDCYNKHCVPSTAPRRHIFSWLAQGVNPYAGTATSGRCSYIATLAVMCKNITSGQWEFSMSKRRDLVVW